MDFTLTKYEDLLNALGDYRIIPVREYDLTIPRFIILRHDLDKKKTYDE